MPEPLNKIDISLLPEDVRISTSGEITIANAEMSKRIVSELAKQEPSLRRAADTNYVGCGGNAYQCGKLAAGGFQEVVDEAKRLSEG